MLMRHFLVTNLLLPVCVLVGYMAPRMVRRLWRRHKNRQTRQAAEQLIAVIDEVIADKRREVGALMEARINLQHDLARMTANEEGA